jgi:adenine-specific DNA glycosylase
VKAGFLMIPMYWRRRSAELVDIQQVGRPIKSCLLIIGAICSMAYGIRTPIVDGNIHRLLTRLLAVHAPQTAPQTIKFLWSAAEELVDKLLKGEGKKGIAGDWNQVCNMTLGM